MELVKVLHKIAKSSLNSTKTCYVLGCKNPCIRAHSISNNRYLKNISSDGRVLYYSVEKFNGKSFSLVPTGKAKATTFPGFCDLHDKYFEPIDNSDYSIGDSKQNFLLAFRAAAREYTVRQGSERMLKDVLDNKYPALNLGDEGRQYISDILVGFSKGTEELNNMREALNINYVRERYWKINTETLVLDRKYPIVASSIFKLEKDNEGNLINDIRDLRALGHPFFFSLFPQEEKTFCVMSWYRHDKQYYDNLLGTNNLSNSEKKVIISNLLASYVENFAVNPEYWGRLPEVVRTSFDDQWGLSTTTEMVIPLIYNNHLSLFV